jgi:hypothetical protein
MDGEITYDVMNEQLELYIRSERKGPRLLVDPLAVVLDCEDKQSSPKRRVQSTPLLLTGSSLLTACVAAVMADNIIVGVLAYATFLLAFLGGALENF